MVYFNNDSNQNFQELFSLQLLKTSTGVQTDMYFFVTVLANKHPVSPTWNTYTRDRQLLSCILSTILT